MDPVAVPAATRLRKCDIKDRTDQTCNEWCLPGTAFCGNHTHLSACTPEELTNATICTLCYVRFYSDTRDICEKCHIASTAVPPTNANCCVLYTCNKKKKAFDGIALDQYKYCGSHHRQYIIDDLLANGMRPCANFVRGCSTGLTADYTRTRCVDCFKTEAAKHVARRGDLKPVVVVDRGAPVVAGADDAQRCTTCTKWQHVNQFIPMNGGDDVKTKTCLVCRTDNRKQDAKRDRAHRNQTVRDLYAANPGCSEAKKAWILHNRDKIVEIMRRHTAKRRLSREYQYLVYMRHAKLKGTTFELSFDEYVNIVNQPCVYCATVPDRGFCGIDRVDNARGYVIDNCASSCSTCNYMKYNVSYYTFARRVEHILAYTGNIANGRLCPEAFEDANIGSPFTTMRNNALYRNLTVNISKDVYDALVGNDRPADDPAMCYICGKPTSDTHLNGVDRVDNTRGYEPDNVATCCKTCNYMKRDNSLDNFYNKCKQIYAVSMLKVGGDVPAPVPAPAEDGPKLTQVDYNRTYHAKIRREIGDEAYREAQAARKAAYREKVRAEAGTPVRVTMTYEERVRINAERIANAQTQQRAPAITLKKVPPTDEERRANQTAKQAAYRATQRAAEGTQVRVPMTDEERLRVNAARKAELRAQERAAAGNPVRVPMTDEERLRVNAARKAELRAQKRAASGK